MNETAKDNSVKDVKAFLSAKVQKLTSALYLVTDFLANQDPLKWRLRDKALDVLAQTNEVGIFDAAVNSIGQLVSLIEVSLSTPGVSQMNFSLLKKEYEEVRHKMLGIELVVPEALPWESGVKGEASGFRIAPAPKLKAESSKLKAITSPRRDTILTFVREHGWSSIKDIAQIMPQVSAKTVQRELADLVQSGTLKREGDRRWSRYHIG